MSYFYVLGLNPEIQMGINAAFVQKNKICFKRSRPNWRLCAVLALCILITELRGQQLSTFWQITIEHGLVNNIVNDITQDQTGYTWVGTSGGLQKFDGKNFVTFTTTNSNLPSNHIQNLYCDETNVLWILTPKGICKYDVTLNDVTPVLTEGNFENGFFFTDTENRVCAYADGKLFSLNLLKSSWRSSQPSWSSVIENPKYIIADRAADQLWIATTANLFCYDNSKHSLQDQNMIGRLRSFVGGDSISEITALNVDKQNDLFLAFTSTSGKYFSFRYDGHAKSWSQLSKGGESAIRNFITTADGTTWALGRKVMQLSRNEWNSVEPVQEELRSRFKSDEVFRTICENRDGSMWIGTTDGIFIFTPQAQQFAYYENPFLLSGKKSSASQANSNIIELRDSLFIITDRKGRPIITNGNFEKVEGFETFLAPIEMATAIHKDINGIVWIAGEKVLFRMNFKTQTLATFPFPANAIVSQITSDRNTGELWMLATDGRLLKFTDHSRRIFEVVNLRLHREFIHPSLAIGIFNQYNLSTLWITTDQQILKFEISNGNLQFFRLPNKTRINQAQDYDTERLVVGTDDGLFYFAKESGNFNPVYSGKEHFNHAVAGVSVDIQKNIWVATRGNGLFRISASGKEARRYGTNEGVVYRGFSSAKNISVRTDQMAIVAPDGIVVFNPLHTPGPLFNPRVQITSFIVNEKETINTINNESTELKWNENNVRVGFSSMSYLYNDQTTFSFMLEGYDQDWTKVMQPEIVKYSNLQPGDYTFRIRCMATSGEVMSDEATLSFSIIAPFWKTLAFKLIVSSSIALSIFLFFYIRHLRRKNIQEIKNKISRDLHDHIGSSLSSISLMLNVAETKMQSNPQQSSALLKKIENTAQLTQENLHDIVWSIQNEKNTMADIVDRMEEFYVSLFEGHSARIEFEIDPSVRELNLDLQKRYNLYLLFKEIVNNGAKYSKATRVTTALRRNGNTVTLSYNDNGVGFSTDPAPEGNGLVNMKQRASLLGGSIDIQSKPGHGTRIELVFPK